MLLVMKKKGEKSTIVNGSFLFFFFTVKPTNVFMHDLLTYWNEWFDYIDCMTYKVSFHYVNDIV